MAELKLRWDLSESRSWETNNPCHPIASFVKVITRKIVETGMECTSSVIVRFVSELFHKHLLNLSRFKPTQILNRSLSISSASHHIPICRAHERARLNGN